MGKLLTKRIREDEVPGSDLSATVSSTRDRAARMNERDALDMAEGLMSQCALSVNSYRLHPGDVTQLHEALLFAEQVQGILIARVQAAYAGQG